MPPIWNRSRLADAVVASALGTLAAALALGIGCATRSAAVDAEVAGVQQEERVLEIARRMAKALADASTLRVRIEMAYDAVQADGQAIEFGATRHIEIRRPDRARVEAIDRDGHERLFVYDGRRVVLSDALQGVYATTEFQGDFEAMLEHVSREFGVPVPLTEFLSRDLIEHLESSDSALWVDAQTLDGTSCDHLAFRNADTGLQIWVPRQGDPLPARVVITYEKAPGRPQFRADLRDWELGVALDDARFGFEPAPGAERIYFNAGGKPLSGASSPEGEEESR